MPRFVRGREVVNFVSHLSLDHLTVGRFYKPVFIYLGIGRKTIDKANIRSLWCFNRTYAAVMGGMHVAHLEASTLARQAARAKC